MKYQFALAVTFLLSVLSCEPLHAMAWKDMWQRPDQQGQALLQEDKSEAAAAKFEDPEWKSSALYRAEKYKESAQALDGIESTDAWYNRGNALAKSGDLKAAVEAYEQALKTDKTHEDAAFNLELVKKAMQQQQSGQQQSDDQKKSDKSGKSDKNDKPEQQSSKKKQGDQGDESGQQSPEQEKDQSGKQSGQKKQQDNQSPESPQSQAGPEKQAKIDAEKEKELQQQAMQSSESKDQQQTGAEEEQMRATAPSEESNQEQTEEMKAQQQWLRRIPDDPGGLLRRKFRYQYRQRGQQPANREGQTW